MTWMFKRNDNTFQGYLTRKTNGLGIIGEINELRLLCIQRINKSIQARFRSFGYAYLRPLDLFSKMLSEIANNS